MERKSRSELIKIIESQKEQLSRYEVRLGDVVNAYKNLLKEKEALDASLKVLTTAQHAITKHPRLPRKKPDQETSPTTEDGPKGKNLDSSLTPTKRQTEGEKSSPVSQEGRHAGVEVQEHPLSVDMQVKTSGGNQDGQESSDMVKEPAGQSEKEVESAETRDNEEEEDVSDISTNMLTLTSTLNTVMEQKAKMEANYQADKKKMMHDYDVKHKDMEDENKKMAAKIEELEKQVTDFKLRMRQEQQAREEEENNHALMIRELQLLLSKERTAKEGLEQQLDETKDKLESSKYFPESKAKDYEDCIAQLQKELDEMKERLGKAEEESSKPSPLLLQLHTEMAEMRREHMAAVLREQMRANEAEEKLRVITSVEEDRVADLETKLSELSEAVGNYEKLRFHDQEVIHKLKERLQQLDCENTALSLHSPVGDGIPDNNIQTVEEMEGLRDQVYKLRSVLKLSMKRSSSDNTSLEQELEGLSKSELESILNSDPTHKACQQELRQLKEEFERYKTKTQSIHRHKSFKELSAQLEDLDKIKARNNFLEKCLKELREDSQLKETELNETVSKLQTDLQDVEERYKRDKEDSELIYRHKVSELEKQVVKQRERTLELIAEKDAEIESLRVRSPGPNSTAAAAFGEVLSYSRRFLDSPMTSSEGLDSTEGASTSPDTNAAVYQLLSRQAGVSSAEPGTLIHYAQQQAWREAENSSLRREMNELELDIRDCTLREVNMKDQCETLKEEIRKLERDRSRESANLEYLKNIVLRFMLTTSYSVKEQMITAIATILQFSPKEVRRVKKVHQGAWW